MAQLKVAAGLLLLSLLLGAQDSQFAGSKTCYGCHPSIYKSFQETDMARSAAPANDWQPGSLPAEAEAKQQQTNRTFSVFHNDSGWHQSESEVGVFRVEYPLDVAIGSGANGLTFLLRRGEYFFQAPLSYYSRTQKWDFSPGYEQVDLGFSRMTPEECVSCHVGRYSRVHDRPGAFNNPAFGELAIGCENCHGPGSQHVQTAGKQPGSIVNPAKLEPRRAENICMNCHQSGGARVLQPGKHYSDFRPGDWLFDTVAILKEPDPNGKHADSDLLEHYSAMEMSRCFRESQGKLGCLTCHDPHVQPRAAETSAYFRAKCLTCHSETSCPVPQKTRAAQRPSDDCAGCHMPKRSVAQVSHSALTNHRIPARAGEAVQPLQQPALDGVVIVNAPPGPPAHLDKVTLLRAYGELSAQNAEYQGRYASLLDALEKEQSQSPIVQEALGHRAVTEDKLEEAVSHLQAALATNEPTVYLELGQVLTKLGRYDDAIEYLKKGVTVDPFNAVMQKTLVLDYIQVKNYAEARQGLQRYVDLFPEDSFMREMLARVAR